MNWWFVLPVLILSGLVQGLTGFGFGLVSMALLPLVIGLQQAAAVATVYTLVVSAMTFINNRHDYNWRLGLSFLLSSFVGVPVGVYLLAKVSEEWMLRFMGFVMLALAVREVVSPQPPKTMRRRFSIPFGFFSGGLSGAFNLGGVPTAMFAYAHPWSRSQIVAFLQVVITSSCVLRIIFYSTAGFYDEFSWQLAAVATVPLALTIWSGNILMRRIHPRHMRMGVFAFVGLFGAYYLFLH